MTTTSSFPFSTMEVPAMDDNMEMASPYQGPADDFEIDIDAMEDQASNADRDMTAADDYMESSHEENHQQNGLPDEDMIDDEAEPSMVDADEYNESNQNIDVQFEEGKTGEEGKTYEADMLEEDYDEDIETPVAERENQAPVSVEHVEIEETPLVDSAEQKPSENNDEKPAEPQPKTEPQGLDEAQTDLEPSTTTAKQPYGEKPNEEAEPVHVEAQLTEEPVKSAEATEQSEQLQPQTDHTDDHQETYEDWQNPDTKDEDSNQVQPSTEEQKEENVEPEQAQTAPETNDREAEQGHGSTETSLYPVKVYYQENEISLFPPKEGDESETFFLQNESLAYDSFGTLISACREVLQNHIQENEVLVIDIETLNFQLTEDSRETHNFSLKQIVDVYLQFCHNDGIEKPEALYLTLSTKLTAAAELSDLMIAASEGKGLSDIQSWGAYPEEGATEYEDAVQQPYPEEHHTPETKEDEVASPALEKPASHGEEAVRHPQNEQTTEQNSAIENGEIEQSAPDVPKPEEQLSASQDSEIPQAASHNSEEQKTDSSATIEPLPTIDTPEDRLETDEAAEQIYDEESEEGEYHEEGEVDEETHPQGDSYDNPAGFVDGLEEHEADHTGDFAEEHAEKYHKLESGHQEQPSEDNQNAGEVQVEEDVATNEHQSLDSSKATEPLLDETSLEQSHPSQPVVNDSPAVTEDTQDIDKDSKPADQAELDTTSEPGEVDETTEIENAFQIANNNEEAGLPFEDDEDYLDLGIGDDLGDFDEGQDVTSASHASGKRIREPDDDELELLGSTTPDAKRSRPS